MGENVVAIIPARGGSKGIRGKNVMDFCGKPLIAWSIEQALASAAVDRVFVTTDDKVIGDVSRRYGAEVINRPAALAGDASTSEEALAHALALIEKDGEVELVVFLQCTSPLREAFDIDGAVEKLRADGADSLFSAATLDDFCVWEEDGGELGSLNYDYMNRGMRQGRKPCYLENGSIYVFKPQVLKDHSNRLGGRMTTFMMEYWKSYEIDAVADVDICRVYMEKNILSEGSSCEGDRREGNPVVPSSIKLIVYDFDGVLTDNKVVFREDGMESVVVNRGDGLAIGMIKELGIEQMILSKEKNRVVAARAEKVGLELLQGVDDKKKILAAHCEGKGIDLGDVAYIGNDLNDLDVMKSVGFSVCPSDACKEVLEISKLVLGARGGDGVVREFVDHFKK